MTPPTDQDSGVARTTRQGKDTRDALSPSLQRVDELTAEGEDAHPQSLTPQEARDNAEFDVEWFSELNRVLGLAAAKIDGSTNFYGEIRTFRSLIFIASNQAARVPSLMRQVRDLELAAQTRDTPHEGESSRDASEARIAKLEAERDEALEALKPFARVAELIHPGMPGTANVQWYTGQTSARDYVTQYWTAEDFRRAARALIRNENQIASREPSVGGK